MTSDFPSEESIFAAAVEMDDPRQRSGYLDEVCAGNLTLRANVERLLLCDETDERFLETPLLSNRAPADRLDPGTMLGHYRILEVMGEGGFGIVYRAQQTQPIQRDVAIKVIKLGMHTNEIVARFEHERQSLAIMNHPNIATVLDAGSTPLVAGQTDSRSPDVDSTAAGPPWTVSGRPYFVMELVQGLPLDKYCQQHNLGLFDRLDLFVLVCRAVQHAHQRGIVHRDLKPTNVLVAHVDGKPRLKVIDFGIAMALNPPVPGEESDPAFPQVVGTPDYMSPEQVSGGNVDTRTDVYALGAILYKLLTGATPLALGRTTQQRIDRAAERIAAEIPPAPSQRITKQYRSDSDVDQPSIDGGAQRVSSSAVRGELDAIVMKAIAKAKDNRYESASDLARDIERFKAHEPISAGPNGRWYRVRKFSRRHRTPVALTGLTMLALTIGGIVAVFGFWEARREQRRAEQAAAHNEEIILLMDEMIGSLHANQGAGADYSLRPQLDEFADSLAGRLPNRPLVEARVRQTIGRAYLSLGNVKAAGDQLQRSHDLWMDHLSDNDRRTARAKIDLAKYELAASRYDLATQLAYAALEVIGREEPSADLIEVLLVLAKVHQEFGDVDEAEEFIREARTVGVAVFGEDHATSLIINTLIARARVAMGKPRQGERLARDVIGNISRQGGTDHANTALARRVLATALRQQGELAEAEDQIQLALDTHREIQGDEGIEVVRDLLILSDIESLRGRSRRGLATAEEALQLAENVSEGRDWLLANAYATIASRLDETSPSQSPAYWEKAAQIRRQVMGERKIVAYTDRRYSYSLRRSGRVAEAIEVALREIESLSKWNSGPSWCVTSYLYVADMYAELDDRDNAIKYTEMAVNAADAKRVVVNLRINIVDTLIWLDHTGLADRQVLEMALYRDGVLKEYCAELGKGLNHLAQQDLAAAESAFRLALDHAKWKEGPRPSSLACLALCRTLIQQQRFDDAVVALAPVEDVLRNANALSPVDRWRTMRWIVRIYEECDREELAAPWRERLEWPM